MQTVLDEMIKLYKLRIDFLNHWQDSLNISHSFYKSVLNEIHYHHMFSILQPFFKENFLKIDKISENYINYIDSKKWMFNDNFYSEGSFWDKPAIENYNRYINRDSLRKENNFSVLYNGAKNNFSGKTRQWLLFSLIKEKLDNQSANFGVYLSDYLSCATNDKFTNYIIKKVNNNNKRMDNILQKDSLRNTYLEDINGKQILWGDILEENLGYVIYLDIWASWCKPCLNELPNTIKTAKSLDSSPVRFVFISIDQDEEKWKGAIIRNNILASNIKNYRLDRKSNLAKYLTEGPIPKHLVVSRNQKNILFNPSSNSSDLLDILIENPKK